MTLQVRVPSGKEGTKFFWITHDQYILLSCNIILAISPSISSNITASPRIHQSQSPTTPIGKSNTTAPYPILDRPKTSIQPASPPIARDSQPILHPILTINPISPLPIQPKLALLFYRLHCSQYLTNCLDDNLLIIPSHPIIPLKLFLEHAHLS